MTETSKTAPPAAVEDGHMQIKFVASVSPIVADPAQSAQLYREALGIGFENEVGDYRFTSRLDGARHLGLWPLAEAAEACFGTDRWPSELPVPQASIEFEVDDVAAGAAELEEAGYELLHGAKVEPWGQIVARLLTPDGLLVGLSRLPDAG